MGVRVQWQVELQQGGEVLLGEVESPGARPWVSVRGCGTNSQGRVHSHVRVCLVW